MNMHYVRAPMTAELNIYDPSAKPEPGPSSLAGLTRAQMQDAMAAAGVEDRKVKMRTEQVWRWVHHHGVTDFEAMTNIAKEQRADLASSFTLNRPEIVERLVSVDGTRKYLVRLAPGVECETVYIPGVGKSGALCVSSQVGCTLNCTFCHTGTQKLVRNLTAQEITAQVMIARDDLNEWTASAANRQISNIVFMGMGEPLYNLDAVSGAIDTLSEGMTIGRKRMTVSTSGVVPKIVELGTRTRSMLAISLHATNDDLRDELVPLNKKYPIAELMDAIRAYPGLNNSNRVTFEYVMLKGVNDTPAEARALVGLLKGMPSKINLIPFNPWPDSPYECSDWETIETFAEIVNRAGYASPIRTPRGRDIFAACGQLKSESERLRASARKNP